MQTFSPERSHSLLLSECSRAHRPLSAKPFERCGLPQVAHTHSHCLSGHRRPCFSLYLCTPCHYNRKQYWSREPGPNSCCSGDHRLESVPGPLSPRGSGGGRVGCGWRRQLHWALRRGRAVAAVGPGMVGLGLHLQPPGPNNHPLSPFLLFDCCYQSLPISQPPVSKLLLAPSAAHFYTGALLLANGSLLAAPSPFCVIL